MRGGLLGADGEDAVDVGRIRPGAAGRIERLRDEGDNVAVLAGGFEGGVEAALAREGVSVDTIVANRLPTDAEGALAGEAEGPLIEGTKDDALADLAAEVDVPMAETVAVGDGANDLPMLEVAGLAVGFEPKPNVEPACDVVVETMTELETVLVEEGVLPAES